MSAATLETIATEPEGLRAIATAEREMPLEPFRGVEQFRFIDEPIFFGRERETRQLLRCMTLYRGVLFYGDSGAGKSSLINASFIPRALDDGYLPNRIRLQPKFGAEMLVDRISYKNAGEAPFMPSSFAEPESREPQLVLSCQEFERRVRVAAKLATDRKKPRPFLIFDQFEEFVTLFEIAPLSETARVEAARAQSAVLETIVRLLRDSVLPIKLLFVFREDYLAKIEKLVFRFPELIEQRMRLLPLEITRPGGSQTCADAEEDLLSKVVRNPLAVRKHGGELLFAPRFSDSLCKRIEIEFRARNEDGFLNSSETQIVCLELWRAEDPETLFDQRGIPGLLEKYSLDALKRLEKEHQDIAVALLSNLVTASGTRNIVARDELVARVQQDEGCDVKLAEAALNALIGKSALVRAELRHDTPFYEIVSEFLVPWIRRQKAERLVEQKRLETEQKLADERKESERQLQQQHQAAETRRLRAEGGWQAEKMRRLKSSRSVLAGFLVLLICLTGVTFKQAHDARLAEAAAKAAREEEAKQRKLAEDARREAEGAVKQVKAAMEAEMSSLEEARIAADEARLATEVAEFERKKAEEREIDAKTSAKTLRNDLDAQLGTKSEAIRKARTLIETIVNWKPGTVIRKSQQDEVLAVLKELAGQAQNEAKQMEERVVRLDQKEVEPIKARVSLPPGSDGWVYSGRVDQGGKWGDRSFDNQTSSDPAQAFADDNILKARAYMNFRAAPNVYDADARLWTSEEIIGLVKPDEHIQVMTIKKVPGPDGDPWKRVWVLGKRVSAPPPRPQPPPPSPVPLRGWGIQIGFGLNYSSERLDHVTKRLEAIQRTRSGHSLSAIIFKKDDQFSLVIGPYADEKTASGLLKKFDDSDSELGKALKIAPNGERHIIGARIRKVQISDSLGNVFRGPSSG